jgi:hypothetical protein
MLGTAVARAARLSRHLGAQPQGCWAMGPRKARQGPPARIYGEFWDQPTSAPTFKAGLGPLRSS